MQVVSNVVQRVGLWKYLGIAKVSGSGRGKDWKKTDGFLTRLPNSIQYFVCIYIGAFSEK